MSSWIISDNSFPNKDKVDFLGNKFLTGNGHIGYRGTLSEFDKNQKTASIINGLYDQVEGKWREPINAPNVLHCRINWNDSDISGLTSDILEHNQSLDLKKGIHQRSTSFKMNDGAVIKISSKRFVSLDCPNLIAMEFIISSDKEGRIKCTAGVLGDVWDINGPHLENYNFHENSNIIGLTCKTREKGYEISATTAIEYPECDIFEKETVKKTMDIVHSFGFNLVAHKTYKIALYGIISHGNETENPTEATKTLATDSRKKGFDLLIKNHESCWSKLWETFDIRIEGDARAQLALRFSLYHLLSIAPHHDKNLSIAARGLSGQVYKGGVFWDTEMFMLPVFSMTRPELARPLLVYRIETLKGALSKAESYGYKGAFYAWESQDEGDDACTLFNINNVLTNRPMRTFFRDKQIHISADIAVSFKDYIEITGDYDILTEGGAEVILECCRFFNSWSYYKKDKARYELLDVTGPDEYHEQVNNNFYTNIMVRESLNSLFWCLEILKTKYSDFYEKFSTHKNLESDLNDLKSLKDEIFVPCPDIKSGLIPQFDGYSDLEDISIKKLLSQKLNTNEYLGGGEGLARWTTILKQADVVLGLSLFSPIYSKEIKSKNFTYYEPRTEHGSSLSACAYATLAGELGDIEKAYKYFIKTAEIDMHEGSKQFVGDLYIGGTHPAANGGAWLTLTRGFMGLRFHQGKLLLNPNIPPKWSSLSCRIKIKNREIEISVTQTTITIKPIGNNGKFIDLEVNGITHSLGDNKNIVITYKKEK